MNQNNVKYLKEFKGGSMAKTFLIEKDGELQVRKEVVDKSNEGLGAYKLKKQADWILSLESELKSKFPIIKEQSFEKNSGYYDMEFCQMETLKDYIIQNQIIDENLLEEAIFFGSKINKIVSNDLTEEEGLQYLENMHFQKMAKRCEIVCKQNGIFNQVYNSPIIEVNGKIYNNFKSLLQKIANDKELVNQLSPKQWYRSHGDFTLQNILTNNDEFKIIDPRGEGDDTIYYDIGKLLQSCHGKYDLLYHGNYECTYELSNHPVINYKFKENEKLFNHVYDIIKNIIPKAFNLKDKWEVNALFYESSHFISMAPFRYEENLPITLICYAIGIQIMTEVLEKWTILKTTKL